MFSETSLNSYRNVVFFILSSILGMLCWPVTLRTEGETVGGWGRSSPSSLSQSAGPVILFQSSFPLHCSFCLFGVFFTTVAFRFEI